MQSPILVTAFISNVNERTDRPVSWYLDHLRILIDQSPITMPKIIFLESKFLSLFTVKKIQGHLYRHKDNVFLIAFEKEEMYLYGLRNHLTNQHVKTGTPSKDTLEYIFVQCHKSEWLRLAYETMLFLHPKRAHEFYFLWVDAAIVYLFQKDTNRFAMALRKMQERFSRFHCHSLANQIYAAKCAYHACAPNDMEREIIWFFAGSIIGGPVSAILWFAEKMKTLVQKYAVEKNHIMWEINFWFLLYSAFPQRFAFYDCDHAPSLIENLFT